MHYVLAVAVCRATTLLFVGAFSLDVGAQSRWTVAAGYPIEVSRQGAVSINGKIYSFSGISAGASVRTSYRFDGAEWAQIASVPIAVQSPAVASDGRYAYIIGGLGSIVPVAGTYRYDPELDQIVGLASDPVPTYGSAAVVLGDKIYKIGGYPALGGPVSTVGVYSISTNSWSTSASYPTEVVYLSAFSEGGYLYALGGGTAKSYRYDPAFDIWEDAPIADLPEWRSAFSVARIPSGFIVAGGMVDGQVSSTAIQYDFLNNVWTFLPDMLAARIYSAGGVAKGCAYFFGGSENINIGSTALNQRFADCLFNGGFDS